MRVVLVTGIWPPDPGGPASHTPALAEFLQRRGHAVEVVTTAGSAPESRNYPVHWVPRRTVLRHLRCALLVRKPLVVKLVSDEVFERMQRSGRFSGSLDAFQPVSDGPRVRFLRRTRGWALRRASRVLSPSAYLRGIALGWGLDADRVSVLPNPAPEIPSLPSRDELQAELSLEGAVLAFAGRLGPQKALGVALEAVAAVPEVTLAVAGDGPDRLALERRARELGLDGRARFLGNVSREGVLRLFRAADASVLSSSWENFRTPSSRRSRSEAR